MSTPSVISAGRGASGQHAAHHAQAPAVLLLASASPRRRELLWQIGVPHAIAIAAIDEQRLGGEAPDECVCRLALAKARHIAQAPPAGHGALPVLGADTAVFIDGTMLGKPTERAAGLAMLSRLANRTHEVLTAVALVTECGHDVRLSRSEVRFRAIDARECERYWASGEGRDKAGGYAVQGLGAVFVKELRGSYSGVMGLPLFETAALLDAAGVPRWQVEAGA
ncbi:MAG: septum formation inhibitor Maf [Proteobacteria bacterium]|nr:septum formation inhibitor Maf [Pseudomonadota bacterium]